MHTYTQGKVVDFSENVIREIPYDPNDTNDTNTGPVYTGPLQVHAPGFAPFKPYLRPTYFYIRVSVLSPDNISSTDLFSLFVYQLIFCLGFTSLTAISFSIVMLTLPGKLHMYVCCGLELGFEPSWLWSSW